jgi:hypothetical protein
MKIYDSEKPLISLHIPKCGGTSLTRILRMWFDDRLFLHYYIEHTNTRPMKYNIEAKQETCIHGHFINYKQIGVYTYYPDACQFTTVVRNPLDLALSAYFYTKGVYARGQLYHEGKKIEKLHFENVNDYLERTKSFFCQFLPWKMNCENYQQIIQDNFVAVGIVEEFQNYINNLAMILKKPIYEAPVLNQSVYDESPAQSCLNKFIERHELEFNIYHYMADLSRKESKNGIIHAGKYLNEERKSYNEIYKAIVLENFKQMYTLLDNKKTCRDFLEDLERNNPEYLGKMYYIMALTAIYKNDSELAFRNISLAIDKEPKKYVYYQLLVFIDQLVDVKNSWKKCVVFGTGSTCEKMLNCFFDVELVEYFVDNNAEKWGTTFFNKNVYPIDQLENENKDEIVIIISSQFYKEIAEQLERIGFDYLYNYFGYYQLVNAEFY